LPVQLDVAIGDPFVSTAAASADYRAHLAGIMAQRAFDTAVGRARTA
jgi:hypothetical protein